MIAPHLFLLAITINWWLNLRKLHEQDMYEGWNFNSGNYLFTTDTK